MDSEQCFSLKWNNYVHNITAAFETLRGEDDFVDCTLSCDGKSIKAHRMLLSACSSYFKEIFKEHPCPHPVIILKGVAYLDLEALVHYMYNGEVSVHQEQLRSFLNTAEFLQVKGLTDRLGSLGAYQQTMENSISALYEEASEPTKVSEILNVAVLKTTPRQLQAISKPASKSPPAKRKRFHVEESMPLPFILPNTDIVEGSVKCKIDVKKEEEDYNEERELNAISNDDTVSELVQVKPEIVYEEDVQTGNTLDSTPGWEMSQPHLGTSPDEFTVYGADRMITRNYPGAQEMQSGEILQSSPKPVHSSCSKIENHAMAEWDLHCEICGKQFHSYRSLRQHIPVHAGKTECPVCCKVFSKVTHMKRHLKNIHTVLSM